MREGGGEGLFEAMVGYDGWAGGVTEDFDDVELFWGGWT